MSDQFGIDLYWQVQKNQHQKAVNFILLFRNGAI